MLIRSSCDIYVSTKIQKVSYSVVALYCYKNEVKEFVHCTVYGMSSVTHAQAIPNNLTNWSCPVF